MTRHLKKRCTSRRSIGLLFATLLYTVMIPTGFMPATDGSFGLQVCHSGLPASTAHEGHGTGHSHLDYCPFGALPGAAPVSHMAAFAPSWSSAPPCIAVFALAIPTSRLQRAHCARAPPALA